VAAGTPCTAVEFGLTSYFTFDAGILSFIQEDRLRIIDTQGSSDVSMSLSAAFNSRFSEKNLVHLYFSHSILSIVLHDPAQDINVLFIFKCELGLQHWECLRVITLQEKGKIFVRNTRKHLYYGTHRIVRGPQQEEWKIIGVSLDTDCPFPPSMRSQRDESTDCDSLSLILSGFTGSEIGVNVDFVIHENIFYGISNGDESDVVEVSFTSTYISVKFPLDDPSQCKPCPVFRRQHGDGVLDDYFTSLSLKVDEQTNSMMVVESRMEWGTRISQQRRSFYLTPFDAILPAEVITKGPANNRLTALASDRSRYIEWTLERQNWQIHSEEENIKSSGKYTGKRCEPFMASDTKLKIYNLSAEAFLDVVHDENCCSTNGYRRKCVRLRFGSRKIGKLQKATHEVKLSRELRQKRREEIEYVLIESTNSEDYKPCHDSPYVLDADEYSPALPNPYQYSPIGFWPKPMLESQQAMKIHEIMNLQTSDGNYPEDVQIEGISDERSIAYLIKDVADIQQNGPDTKGKLVFLSFDKNASISSLNMLNDSPSHHPPQFTSRRLSKLPIRPLSIHEGAQHQETKAEPMEGLIWESDRRDSLGILPEDIDLNFDDDGWGCF
jgi:hypothetical protein